MEGNELYKILVGFGFVILALFLIRVCWNAFLDIFHYPSEERRSADQELKNTDANSFANWYWKNVIQKYGKKAGEYEAFKSAG